MRMITGNIAVLIFLGLFSTAAPVQGATRDFDKPVEYAPIFVKDLKPELISVEKLKKGLDVVYFLEYFERSLNDLPKPGESTYETVKGKPVLELNHQFDKEEVFDSGSNRGVAMRMQGYIHFAEAGLYQLQALSNDGVGVTIGGQTVISDPEQHSDRLSNIGHVTIEQPGYYAATIEYFQRKGTAALKLFWKTPNTDEFVPVPQNAYVHLN